MPLHAYLRSTSMLSGIVGASFLSVFTVHAADMPTKAAPYVPPPALPAVDGINYKGEIFGGALASEGIGGAKGSVTVPLGFRYGFQLDGTAASYDGRFLGAAGGHLFWRDPTVGLFGLYGSYTHYSRIGGLHAHHVAVEFERYMGQWSLQGIAGVEGGNTRSWNNGITTFTYDVETRFFDKINLNYYLNENTMLTIGHRYLGGKHALALGGEWSRPIAPGTLGSFYVEGRIGEDKSSGVWVGLKLYKGNADKPLIRRHREDDPFNWTPDTLFTIINQFGTQPLVPPPGGGTGGTGGSGGSGPV